MQSQLAAEKANSERLDGLLAAVQSNAQSWLVNAEKLDMLLRDYAIVHFMAALMQRKDFDLQSGRLRCPHVSLAPHFIAAGQADAMLAARKDAQ